jgi:type II secretory pathway pseudopilin PulG
MLASRFHNNNKTASGNCARVQPVSSERRLTSAFTLLEVILALTIAVGIIVVLLFFYQQASNLRNQVLEETERISAIRLVMDLITSELRTTRFDPAFTQAFAGRSNSIQFIKTDMPSFAAWTGGELGRGPADSDLKLVRYYMESFDETNIVGLVRSEEPLVHLHSTAMEDEQESFLSEELIGEIRFLQFRYWNGVQWVDSWRSASLPTAVEITLAAEPVELQDLAPDQQFPLEAFRRVISLPVRTGSDSTAPNADYDDELEEDEL